MKNYVRQVCASSVFCRLSSLLCFLCLSGSFSLAAEPEINRYDLGQRLVQLERAWDAHPEAAARARALPVLKLAVPQLLAGKEVEAAATLDRARLLLASAEPTAAERWAAALLVHPVKRLVDPANGPLSVRIVPAYAAGVPPAEAVLRLTFIAADSKAQLPAVDVSISKLPTAITVATGKLPEGDYQLRGEVIFDRRSLATYGTGVSAVRDLAKRLTALRSLASRVAAESVDVKTLHSITGQLTSLAWGVAPETNFPAARLLAEAEALQKAMANGQEFYGPQLTGQYWLTVPTGAAGTPIRLFVPDVAKAGKPLPLLVALHGAGGSENLFFDAYGYGLIARLAQERGWMVVAPRAGWLFDAPPPVPAIIDQLAKIYPVDQKRVFIVGHSMGAMQAVALAQQTPGRFAAIAALAGGGSVTQPAAFKNLPVFIGCGSDDFLLGGAKRLAQALEKAGAPRVTFKEYAGVEHMLVVQQALPEVFKFFAASSLNK